MPDLSDELVFHRKWWWDPIDMEIFKQLEDPLQRQLVAVSLDTQAAMLKTQAEGLQKLSGLLQGAKPR
jgi:hypothetical protein